MKYLMGRHYLAGLVIFGVLSIACNQVGLTDQGGAQKQTINQASEEAQAEACIEGDQITLKFPTEIQACMDEGRLFNFARNVCLDVMVASFECNFADLAEQVRVIGVNSETVAQAKGDGALLVACGEKNLGKTIVAQWYYPPNAIDRCDDENPSSRIVTACYKLYQQGPAPALETEDERRQALQACLNE